MRERDEMQSQKENIQRILEMKEVEVREAKMEAQKLSDILTKKPNASAPSPTAKMQILGLDIKTKPFGDSHWLTSEGVDNR